MTPDTQVAYERIEAFCDNPKVDEGSLAFRGGMTLRVSDLRTVLSALKGKLEPNEIEGVYPRSLKLMADSLEAQQVEIERLNALLSEAAIRERAGDVKKLTRIVGKAFQGDAYGAVLNEIIAQAIRDYILQEP